MGALPAEALFDVARARCLVVGAGGAGTAAAGVLAASGAIVVLADEDPARLEAARAAVERRGAALETTEVDLRRGAAVRGVVADLLRRRGGLDVAVLAHHRAPGPGYLDPDGRLWDDPTKRFRDALEDDLDGTFYTLQAVAGAMRAAGRGRIVVVTTTAARRSDPFASYGDVAAGAALVNAARQAAHELGPDGVRVNVVVAGGPSLLDAAARREAHLESVPLARIGTPEDLEGVVLFLAGPGSSYVTGAVISVDGGALTRQNPLPGATAQGLSAPSIKNTPPET